MQNDVAGNTSYLSEVISRSTSLLFSEISCETSHFRAVAAATLIESSKHAHLLLTIRVRHLSLLEVRKKLSCEETRSGKIVHRSIAVNGVLRLLLRIGGDSGGILRLIWLWRNVVFVLVIGGDVVLRLLRSARGSVLLLRCVLLVGLYDRMETRQMGELANVEE